MSRACGEGTNNRAEYLALIALLELARDLGLRDLYVQADSELVIKQMNGEYQVKKAELQPLHRRANDIAGSFESIEFHHIRRDKNWEADALATQAFEHRRAEPSASR